MDEMLARFKDLTALPVDQRHLPAHLAYIGLADFTSDYLAHIYMKKKTK